jgi:hypothetical protein
LAAALAIDDPRITSLRYEDLVADPDRHLDRLQRFIGLEPLAGLHEYGDAPKRVYGDPCGIHRHRGVQRASLQSFLAEASNQPTLWRLLDDYRRALGTRLLTQLGYDDAALQAQLNSIRPPGTRLAPTLASQVSPRPAEPRRSYLRLRRLAAEGTGRLRRAA